jgi:type II secretory ATPase GspE/PulE/Tfp pilus assembly ATPase PilB-like protein
VFVLVSWWKIVFFFVPLLAWAWLVSTVFDKHADRFHLGREKWGALHLTLGLIAVVVGIGMPLPAWWGFLVGVVAMVAILFVDVMLFVSITNKDERVPEQHHMKLDMSSFTDASAKRKAAKQAATVSLEIRTSGGHTLKAPDKETPEYEIRAEAEQLFIKARDMRAGRVVITARGKEGSSTAELIIDGVRHPGEQYPTARAKAIIDFWKSCADLDVKDIRRRLVGTCRVIKDEVKTDVRVTSVGQQGGLRLTMQFDAADTVRRSPDKLGLTKEQREALDEMAADQGGLVLLAATPQNGRTTSLYSMLQLHDAYTSNIQTLETEPMAELEGVRQVKFNPDDEAEYSTTVRSILRRDPDVVAVAEMPDVETAKEIAEADLSHTRVYASLNADAALARSRSG